MKLDAHGAKAGAIGGTSFADENGKNPYEQPSHAVPAASVQEPGCGFLQSNVNNSMKDFRVAMDMGYLSRQTKNRQKEIDWIYCWVMAESGRRRSDLGSALWCARRLRRLSARRQKRWSPEPHRIPAYMCLRNSKPV
jgi:hypothetical protein